MSVTSLNEKTDLQESAAPVAAPTGAPLADVAQRVDEKLNELDRIWELLPDVEDVEGTDTVKLPEELTVSVVIPVYNEKSTIFDVIARVNALPVTTEIIVVDDCSTDGTRGWLETIKGAPGLKVILKDRNEGKGAALRTGFGAATGDVIVIQDADLEYNPRDILDVVRPIAEGDADVVYGSRFLDPTQDKSFLHRMLNGLLTKFSNCFTGLGLTDMETCYKAFRRPIICQLNLRQNRFGFEPEVTAKLARRRYRFAERPIRYSARSYAEGKKIGVRDAFNALYCIVRYGIAE